MAKASSMAQQAANVHEDDLPTLRSLAQLQELHDQLNALRTLLPRRLLAPITTALHPNGSLKSSSLNSETGNLRDERAPNALFAELQRIAKDGVEEVETFKQSWHAEAIEQLLEKGKDMKTTDIPQGSDVWVTDYRDLIKNFDSGNEKPAPAKEEPMAVETPVENEEVGKVVQECKDLYPALKINDKEGDSAGQAFAVRIGGLKLEVLRKDDLWIVQEEDGQSRISELQKDVIKHLNNRPKKGSLKGLLEMIASYVDVKTKPCDKCSKVIDPKFKFPHIRIREEIPAQEGVEAKLNWKAYHEDCV